MAWNTSTKLARRRTVTYQVPDFQAPATATGPFSAASVAYLRHVGPKLCRAKTWPATVAVLPTATLCT
ncbi:hypothetical protein DFQ27_002221 [Actinomortierella ambigua]|uniref:Uncharacterized protein n=1 Tax=Actinomortierella ambigua TaxID=1343610 RepID=A0A9P6U7K4_9FUNG|nr:hypothetical protein DFQ27_002221 [Actinomortierella ambigua]